MASSRCIDPPVGADIHNIALSVPKTGSIKNVEDLAGKRIVTSFEVVSGEYFGMLDEKFNISGDQKTKIEYTGGSVEAACSLGLADAIESGDTMRTAIAVLLESEAVLIKSTIPKHPELFPLNPHRPGDKSDSWCHRSQQICCAGIKHLPTATLVTPGCRASTVSPLEEENWVAVTCMVEKRTIAGIMDDLVKAGAEDILIFNLDNCRV
ncbi:HisG, C-terminal domain-containing protein [Mycena capillaripes]|nr:HisG, C-terminal domain-containing protein [Mycena capillaripes]